MTLVATQAKPRHWLAPVIVLAILGVLIAAGVYTAKTDPPVQTVLQVADAGPLHAHYQTIAGKQVAVCDPTTAAVANEARQGVLGQVRVPGPGVVTVTVTGGPGNITRRAIQQTTGLDEVVSWDLPITAPATSITIFARVGRRTGSCQLAPPVYTASRLNPLSGWVG